MSFKKENPYGILLLAIPFVAGGIVLLLRNAPLLVFAYPAQGAVRAPDANTFDIETASVGMLHAGGIFGILVGGLIVWTYFRVRNS